jgi:hypothetical protein
LKLASSAEAHYFRGSFVNRKRSESGQLPPPNDVRSDGSVLRKQPWRAAAGNGARDRLEPRHAAGPRQSLTFPLVQKSRFLHKNQAIDGQGLFCAEMTCKSLARFACPGEAGLWYYPLMNYTPKPVPESIAASLARSEAQIAAGQTVPLEPVLDRLRSSIARMQADEKPKTPTPEA